MTSPPPKKKKNRSRTSFAVMLYSLSVPCSTGYSIQSFHERLQSEAFFFFFFPLQIVTDSNNQGRTGDTSPFS